MEVAEDFRKAGVQAVAAVPPLNSEVATQASLLPLGGIPDALTVLCNEVGEGVSYESDERGFRNPKGAFGKGPIDVGAVGDSYTQGVCYDADEPYCREVSEDCQCRLDRKRPIARTGSAC